jgi:tRNA(Ile)-lysidine synthase
MIHVQHKIPRTVGVAVSGGVDSMAVVDFLRRRHLVTVLHFNHGTAYSSSAQELVSLYCQRHNLNLVVGKLEQEKPQHKSWEEHWRDERYKFFTSQDHIVVLGHHLDDCVETYVFNMCHGNGYTIPYQHANCIRPFRLTRKEEFIDWAKRHNVPWVDDPSNNDTNYARNQKVVYKKIKAETIKSI